MIIPRIKGIASVAEDAWIIVRLEKYFEMDQNEKIKLSRQVMQISGVFSLVVALLLLINFLQTTKHEPLESVALNSMVERLADQPNNEELMQEIREFDLLARKAYFTSQWQIRTGALLLVIGAVLFGASLKVYTDLRKRIEEPESATAEITLARRLSLRWLSIVGGIILVLGMASALFTTSYLEDYLAKGSSPDEAAPPADLDEPIEVITLSGDSTMGGQDTLGEREETGMADAEAASQEAIPSGPAKDAAEKVYTFADFKKYHNTFRGPFGQGISYRTGIPTEWDGATGNNVLWKVTLSKPGYNSPVLWGNRIFLSGADDEARIVSCYDSNSGALLWEKKADNIPGSPTTMPNVTDDTGLAAPTVAVDGNRVYAIFATGDIIAFDLEGNRVWAKNLGVPRNHYGHSSSLMVWNNKVIVQYDTGAGGRMMALNGATGEPEWDIRRENNISWASPVLIDHAGKIQVVTNTDPLVAGYDAETGKEIWKVSAMMGEVGPSVAYDKGVVFANNEYASLVAINAEPGASVLWENYDYLSEAASPVAKDGLLYLATSFGVIVCYDATSGEQVWELDVGSQIYSSPIIAENKLYLMDNDGVMHIMKADRSGTMINQPALGEPSYAIPAFADGRIYIRGAESLYCIGK
jgi:outer membrane protein assembly factor BamB